MIHENYLKKIILRKRREVKKILSIIKNDTNHPLQQVVKTHLEPSRLFRNALKKSCLAVIAEIKRKSPSLGFLSEINEPDQLAKKYCLGGASAISILTDSEGFGGSLDDLRKVSAALINNLVPIPLLRKDFIIHPIQLAETALSGASCILLIASILKERLKDFIKKADLLGLETLIEVHDENDLHFALEANAPIIGINHRNLKTFEVDLRLSEQLIKKIPDSCIKVAESGIKTIETAKKLRNIGFDAVLIGEMLVTTSDPEKCIKEIGAI